MYNPQINTLIQVADAGSFSKAADKMYITAIMCHVTDGNELKRCTLEELEIHGVVIAIVRKLEAEEQPDQTMWAEFEGKYPASRLLTTTP